MQSAVPQRHIWVLRSKADANKRSEYKVFVWSNYINLNKTNKNKPEHV